MKILSWNINGLRAVWKKEFTATLESLHPDIIGLQEIKLQEPQLSDEMRHLPGYESFWSFCTVKKGYSGVGLYTRKMPLAVYHGIGIDRFDAEGRILRLDFDHFILFNIYFPNGSQGEERLQYKLDFYDAFFSHVDALRAAGRSILIMGDYNTAHNEIDLKNPRANEKNSGFLRIERDWMDEIIRRGYVDTFRYLHPEKIAYSWWSYRFGARSRNIGWRIDYVFLTPDLAADHLERAEILTGIMGSDHCPVGVELTV